MNVIRAIKTILMASCLLAAFAATDAAAAQKAKPANNNEIIAMQSAKPDADKPGPVQLEYFGHMAFRITTPGGLTLLVDPWKNDPSGTWGVWFPKEFPETRADVALSTHGHYDHNALHRVKSHMILDRVAGQWKFADVRVTGIADKHQYKSPGPVLWTELFPERGIDPVPPNNPPILDNTIFVFETGGLRIVHWGDNRPDAPESVYKAVGRPDVLILPIDDSQHVLGYAEIAEVLKKLRPHVIIPAHYLVKGVSSVASTLMPADKWAAGNAVVKKMAEPAVQLDAAAIRKLNGAVWYFGNTSVKP